MSNTAIAYVTYAGVLITMITFGAELQGLHPQYGLIASQFIAILLPAVFVRRFTKTLCEQPGFRRLGLKFSGVMWLVVTSALLGFSANAATGLLGELVPSFGEFAVKYEAIIEALLYPGDPILRVAAVAAIVIVAPMCEETLFRGTILPLQHGPNRSILLSALLNGFLFALLHFNPVGFPALIVIGAFFAHVALLTRSVWPAIIAHATLNLVNGVLVPEVVRTTGFASDPSMLDYVVMVGLTTPAVGCLWLFGARFVRGSSHE